MKNKSKSYTLVLVALIVIAGIAVYFIYQPRTGSSPNTMDAFAKCLSDRGFVMYGLYSCPHCEAEKQLFGNSFKYVKYVECSEDPQKCTAEKVDAVPTWIESDGSRLVGTQPLQALAQASGCRLPE